MIVDGRNRYKACEAVKVKPQFREWNGQGSLVTFVVSLNLHRRHLTSTQQGVIGVKMLPLLEAEAKERQRRAGGDRKSEDYQKSVEPILAQPINRRDRANAVVGNDTLVAKWRLNQHRHNRQQMLSAQSR